MAVSVSAVADASVVPSSQPEVKLFGRWSFEDVEVSSRLKNSKLL